MSLGRGTAVPENGRLGILFHSDSGLQAPAIRALAFLIPGLSRFFIPGGRHGLILFLPDAEFIETPEHHLRRHKALPCRCLIPGKCLLIVRLRPDAFMVAAGKLKLGVRIVFLGRIPVAGEGTRLVLRRSDPVAETVSEAVDGRDVALHGRLFIKPEGLLRLRLRPDSLFHAAAQVADAPEAPPGGRLTVAEKPARVCLLASLFQPEIPEHRPLAAVKLPFFCFLHHAAALRAGS